MVNYGVSRACDMCKKRRKKCDETRPACLRCVKSRRPCPGYKDDTLLFFRHYAPANVVLVPALERWTPSSDYLFETTAIDVFLNNVVVRSRDRSHSRGFLDGMHHIFTSSATNSTLISAAKIVILGSIANRYRRESLSMLVRRQYGKLLTDYSTALSQEAGSLSVEHFFTTVLLGLYEMVASDSTSPTKHLVHVHGLMSILKKGITDSSPTSSVGVYSPGTHLVTLGTVTHGQGNGILSSPLEKTHRRSLDQIIIALSPLTSRAEALLTQPYPSAEALIHLRHDLLALLDELVYWPNDQPPAWVPRLVGHVWQQGFCFSGPVEEYFDLYVATAWNAWRSTHMICIDHLVHVTNALGQHEFVPLYIQRANALAAGAKASIPYHLSQDVGDYVKHANVGKPFLHSDRLVGGLLLLHPLYAIARCTVVDSETRQYIANTLRWIGMEVGIGQANVLADCLQPDEQGPSAMQSSPVSFLDALEGHLLITASMMLEPIQMSRSTLLR
ncbi:hypothetical protein FHETE_9339 [Fusarium heterosporum]|uniref:Zn(2)-C6 fungal-type domain-containing protein n=1 Tax=Fusarium heterosporum TaxID=42747 RepID=A0A8H5WIB6_FUSHE|nr:hypothetical protein FHETE_9339 [Fusarium heterosporum]